jgi:hypothetical protein
MRFHRYDTNSQYSYQMIVLAPCPRFNLTAKQRITILTGIDPKPGDLVAILFSGKCRPGRYQKTGIELSNGTIAPIKFIRILGVIEPESSVARSD